MGTGKSTFFVIIFALLHDATVRLVAPNIEVARGLLESLQHTYMAMKTMSEYASFCRQNTEDIIGYKIDGAICYRQITVMTPGYVDHADGDEWTFFD